MEPQAIQALVGLGGAATVAALVARLVAPFVGDDRSGSAAKVGASLVMALAWNVLVYLLLVEGGAVARLSWPSVILNGIFSFLAATGTYETSKLMRPHEA